MRVSLSHCVSGVVCATRASVSSDAVTASAAASAARASAAMASVMRPAAAVMSLEREYVFTVFTAEHCIMYNALYSKQSGT